MAVEGAWLRRLGPVHVEQNFRGTFSFRVQRYAQALIGPGGLGIRLGQRSLAFSRLVACSTSDTEGHRTMGTLGWMALTIGLGSGVAYLRHWIGKEIDRGSVVHPAGKSQIM